MFDRESALAGALTPGGRDGADGRRRLRIGEARGWGLVQVAAFSTTLTELETAVRSALNANLPPRIGEVVNVDGRRLLKTGPNQFWIITRDSEDLASRLQATVPPAVGAVTPLSHSRTSIVIEGPQARELLGKGIPLDLHPDVFPPGRFALTGLHHTPVLIHRSSEDRYELYVMRTFALSTWDWIIDSAMALGYDLFVEK